MKKLFIFISLFVSFSAQAQQAYFKNLVKQLKAHQNDTITADMEFLSGTEKISYRVYKKGAKVRTDFTMNGMTGHTFTDEEKTTFFIPQQKVLMTQKNEGPSPFVIPDAQTFEGCTVGEKKTINSLEYRQINCNQTDQPLDMCISETYYIPVQTNFNGSIIQAKNIRADYFSDAVLIPPKTADEQILTPNF